jgi:hypothetical protein
MYKLPWDMTTPTHRQYNPFWALRQVMDAVSEAADIMGRLRNSEGASPTLFPPHNASFFCIPFLATIQQVSEMSGRMLKCRPSEQDHAMLLSHATANPVEASMRCQTAITLLCWVEERPLGCYSQVWTKCHLADLCVTKWIASSF